MADLRETLFEALRRADAGIVPVNYARDHGYERTGTTGYVTDNDWHAFRADAVLAALEAWEPSEAAVRNAEIAYDTPTEPETGETDWGGPLPNRSARMVKAFRALLAAAREEK